MMSKLTTVKDCINDVSLELGMTQASITSVVGNLDQDISQMAALLHAVAAEVLMEEHYKITLGDDLWLYDVTAKTNKDRISADNDVILFDPRLAIDGLKYRFLKAKGLEFGEEMRDFTTRLNKLAAQMNAKVLDLDSDDGRVI